MALHPWQPSGSRDDSKFGGIRKAPMEGFAKPRPGSIKVCLLVAMSPRYFQAEQPHRHCHLARPGPYSGEAYDRRLAMKLLSRLRSGSMLLADRAYDADWIGAFVNEQGAWFRPEAIGESRSASAHTSIAPDQPFTFARPIGNEMAQVQTGHRNIGSHGKRVHPQIP
jgi:hypothetical protein